MSEKANGDKPYFIQIGKVSDIGGMSEQQDSYFVVKKSDVTLIGVLDGHNKIYGTVISNASVAYVEKFIETHEDLLSNPVGFLSDCFETLQTHIKQTLIAHVESKGLEVQVEPTGAIVKSTRGLSNWSSVGGGTTFSMIMLIKDMLYVANVGDSDGVLYSERPVLSSNDLHYEVDVSCQTTERVALDVENEPSNMLMLTSDHSPDSLYEYNRIRKQCPSDTNANIAKAMVVYDNQNVIVKSQCRPVFDVATDGTLIKNTSVMLGSYYKTVRKEWSVYITTHPSSRHSECLAVSRSIGDFTLSEYGVTYKPEIQSVNLKPIFEKLEKTVETTSTPTPNTLCIVLASDGLWDSWLYPDVGEFVMHESCLNKIRSSPETGAQEVVDSLMSRNTIFATRYFGNSRDNATAIAMYITK